MIARCPICSSRHDIPPPGLDGGGTLVDCASCGHTWVEPPSAATELLMQDATAPEPVPKTGAIHPLIEAARGAQKEFRLRRRARRVQLAAWAGLAVLTLAPAIGVLAFPEQVVAAVPGSIGLYGWMGREVNIYGLEIRKVDLQHLIVDGRKVIAIKGELTNVSSTERKIPWLRFGLRSKDNAEVYHWTLDTEVRPLRPGESTSFVTRLASPPDAARNLEIRFARADEVGSDNGP
ncbi:MAG: zinc-ribbon domain-containing protein [Aestuariivirga sp.]|nr:zinc-ribbon domain-containing protein [Aestuariivirga sp.]